MPDYQKGKIYKLWSPSKNLVYYGSTTQSISQRLTDHIKRKRYNKQRQYTSNIILDCEDYKIEVIEECPCNNRQQLERKEGEYIKANECVNKYVAGRTDKEWREDNRQHLLNFDRKRSKKRWETKKQNNAIYKWLLMTGLIH